MYETIMEIKTDELPTIILNTSEYTSIFNEDSTHEEHILNTINCFFQPRNSNKDRVNIVDAKEYENINYNRYRGFIVNHSIIEEEHQLLASGLMTKRIIRELNNNLEIEGYINSINVLIDGMRENIKDKLPLSIKMFDIKQFMKLLSFKYDYSMDYSRLINRLEQIIPLIVEEMNYQAKGKAFLIYFYPESSLSIKEQIRFRKLFDKLQLPIIVLTESPYFLAHSLNGMNYFIENIQMITSEFFESCYWNAPLNFKKEELQKRFELLFNKYCRVLEINPTITNYNMGDIIVFEDIDIYMIVSFFKHCKLEYELDIDKKIISKALSNYLYL